MDPTLQPARKRPRVRRLLGIVVRIGMLAVLLGATGVVAIVAMVGWFGRAADDIDLAPLLEYQPPQVTRVLARDGTPIGEIVIERRTVVEWDAMPHSLIDAFVAAEDADFFEHEGLDWTGIARATLNNLVPGEARQGASTITQQVIKNTLVGSARTLERKSQELRLVGRVEALLDKREIFTIYVNAIYLGEGCHGVEQAARHYFGKSVGEIDLGEAALLAALPRSPGLVTPYRQPDRLERRRKHVLGRMIALGKITVDEAQPFLARPPKVLDRDAPRDRAAFGDADEFVALARRELIRRYGEDRLATLGATVWTTVDLDVQRAARAGGRDQLDALERRHGHGSHARPLAAKARARLSARAPDRLELGESHTVVVVGHEHADEGWLDAELGRHRMRIELPVDARSVARFPIDSALTVTITDTTVDRVRAELEPGPELALVLADVRTGELRALIGGRDFRQADFDRSRAARRQPGSAFKPILYGAALRSGRFTAASRGRGGPEGQPMRLREALAQSDNAVALALFAAIGPDAVHEFARDLGLVSPLGRQPSLALGTSEVTPIDLLTGYLTLARGGVGIEPRGILRIEVPDDLHGHRVEPLAAPTRARMFGIEAEVAAVLTSMLRSVVDEGTAKLASELGRPVAGKTGTTDDARDAWFAGYTPDHVAVAWVGFDVPRSLGKLESGGELALPIWLAAMHVAEHDLPIREFDRPPGLTRAWIDRETGGPACRSRTTWLAPQRCEWFASSCTGMSERAHTAFLECSDPDRWVDELFVRGTAPPEREDRPFGSQPNRPDPHERSGPPRRHTEVALTSVSLFLDDPERADPEHLGAESLGPPLAERRRAIETRWRKSIAAERRERAQWGWPLLSIGARVRVRVRVGPRGEIDAIQIRETSGDRWLDARAEAALREGLAEPATPLPEALFEPFERSAELGFELIVGEPLDQVRP
jgi:penicillin-binding protein 1A